MIINKKTVVIDIKTTGLDIYNDEIIEFAALSFEEGKEPESFSTLISTQREVSERILRRAGIAPVELKEAPPLVSYHDKIISFFQNAILVGHDIELGLGFLEYALHIHFDNQVWDTLDIARIFYPTMGNPKEKVSRSLPNAQTTWALLQACWEKGLTLDLGFYERAITIAGSGKVTSFLRELQKNLKKKFPERLIRTDLVLNDQDLGLFVEIPEEEEPIPEDVGWIEECFSASGILESNLKGYESRLGQLHMAKAIGKSLTTSTHIAIEAGTGTGKSYAYLIPSLWWAKKTGKKVVVATHTIPLQDQIYKKDLPILAKVLPFSFRGALLKGKGNYLCLKRWLALQGLAQELEYSERLALLSIMVWLRETTTGDWQEISQIPKIGRIWGSLNAEEESCLPGKCPHANRCYMLRVRKQAEEANIIIINHSLLFSDIKTGNNILPEYHELVVDEAHHLHESALEQLGNEISLEQINRYLNLLTSPGAGSFYGNVKARAQLWKSILTEGLWERFREHLEKLPHASEDFYQQAVEVFASYEQILGNELAFRFTVKCHQENWWSALAVQIENLLGRLKSIADLLKTMYKLLESQDNEEGAALAHDISGRIRSLEEIKDCFVLAQQIEQPTRVSWLEHNNRIVLKTSPVDVSSILKEKLFAPLNSSVLTSATISIANSFQHFLREVGLAESTSTLVVDSPFDYDRQMQLMVVKDMVRADQNDLLEPEDVASFISEVVERMQGRTLVLFTSHRYLRSIHLPLSNHLAGGGIELLAQGIDGGRQAILETFLNNPKSVLLGANSFWEGIDIPGNKLACVILIKLPFAPPNRPLIAARSEYLEAQGKNSFYEYLLPEAVLRFKQGFGRLIRSRSDRGIVILCDGRVIDKRYGRVFLNSLPLRTHIRSSREQILDKIDLWLDEESQKELL